MRKNVNLCGSDVAGKYLSHIAADQFLDVSDINQLQRVYPEIVHELKESFARLIDSNCVWGMARSTECRILKLLSSIMPLTKVKTSIFLLRGLSPSIFSLFFDILPIDDRLVLTSLPDCHYLMLQMTKCFCQTHDHFLSSSGFDDQSNESNSFDQISQNHFAIILRKLSDLFRLMNLLTEQTQSVLVEWLNQIIIRIGDQFQAISQMNEMLLFRSTLLLEPFFSLFLFKSNEIRKTLVKCMYKIQVFNLLLSDDVRCEGLLNKFITKLCKCADELDLEQFRTIWTRIPSTLLIRLFGLIDVELDSKSVSQPILDKMCMEPFEFQIIADFLFEHKCTPIVSFFQDSLTSRKWVIEAGEFWYTNLNGGVNLEGLTFSDEELKQKSQRRNILQKWLFIVAQFAHFCVVNRMKTPIGKTPLETFTKFEGELRFLLTSVMTRKSSTNLTISSNFTPTDVVKSNEDEDENGSLANSDDAVCQQLSKCDRNLRPEEEWFRVRMLLHCVDMVDKMICYAVRGSMLGITSEMPLNARQFCSINFTTCTDWLTRTTLPLMGVAFHNGNYAQIVRLGGFLLIEFERKHFSAHRETSVRLDSTTQIALCWIVRALAQLGVPQAIRGVRIWAESIFGVTQPFEWCHFAELLASARVEEAVDGFLCILRSAKQPKEQSNGGSAFVLSEPVLNAVEEMLSVAVGILRLPTNEPRIRDVIDSNKQTSANHFPRERWNRILALSSWDQLGNLYPTESKHEPWEVQGIFLDSEAQILRLFEIRQQKTMANGVFNRTNTSEALFTLQDELSDFAQFLILGGNEHSDCVEHSKLAVLHALCTGIQHLNPHHYQHNYQKTFGNQFGRQMRSPIKFAGSTPILLEFDLAALMNNYKVNSLHRLEIGQLYCCWMNRLYGEQKEHSFAVKKLHREMAKLAQFLGNPQLSAFHQRLAGVYAGMVNPSDEFYLNQFHSQQQQQQIVQVAVPPGFEPMFQLTSPFDTDNFANNLSSPCSQLDVPANTVAQSLLSEQFDGDKMRSVIDVSFYVGRINLLKNATVKP